MGAGPSSPPARSDSDHFHAEGGRKPMSLNIRTWLEAGGFGQYANAFEANEIDGEALYALTEEHLKELGIPRRHRVKLLKAIAQLPPDSSPSGGAERRGSIGVRTAGTAPGATATLERR